MRTRMQPILTIGLALLGCAGALAQYDLGWNAVTGGGGRSTGGTLELSGSAGQADAGNVFAGGGFTLVGGFWAGITAAGNHPGDLNCDGAVNFSDINPFVLALSNPAGYQQQFPNCNILNGDVNGDGRVDFADINPFVALLAGG